MEGWNSYIILGGETRVKDLLKNLVVGNKHLFTYDNNVIAWNLGRSFRNYSSNDIPHLRLEANRPSFEHRISAKEKIKY